jgi:hypothetical protein
MKKGFSRPKLGDIYELRLSKGVAYVQYVLRDAEPMQFGPVIRILPGVFLERIADPNALADQEERFLARYWIPGAVNDGDAVLVGHGEISARFDQWPRFKNHPISKWRIWDSTGVETEDPLKVEHYDLPLMELVSHPTLVLRIESGWHPRDEVFHYNPELRETYVKWEREKGQLS